MASTAGFCFAAAAFSCANEFMTAARSGPELTASQSGAWEGCCVMQPPDGNLTSQSSCQRAVETEAGSYTASEQGPGGGKKPEGGQVAAVAGRWWGLGRAEEGSWGRTGYWQKLLSPDCPSLLAHPEGVHSCQLPQLVSLALLAQLKAQPSSEGLPQKCKVSAEQCGNSHDMHKTLQYPQARPLLLGFPILAHIVQPELCLLAVFQLSMPEQQAFPLHQVLAPMIEYSSSAPL
ncbi:MAG: hypothetical protein FRX49_01690 [Trebouxia sp. A1-2]|nr:MAG: hypothetical protein FRX49_01690 [Trebouxia sp. A1-2]